jgi:hypothetical protein
MMYMHSSTKVVLRRVPLPQAFSSSVHTYRSRCAVSEPRVFVSQFQRMKITEKGGEFAEIK